MGQSIKISDEEMELVRREAKLSSRSIAGQITHWIRIGRSIERSPEFSYADVRAALQARLSPDELTGEEQEVYVEDLLLAASEPTSEQKAFFRERRKKGLGVGLGPDGELVEPSRKSGA